MNYDSGRDLVLANEDEANGWSIVNVDEESSK